MPSSNKIGQAEGIAYTGSITVTLVQGKTTVSKHTYKNKGGTQLFNFLAGCLATDGYTIANAPRFIKLFTFTDTAQKINKGITEESIPVCAAVHLNASEVIEVQNAPAAYLHFTIPCSVISSNTTSGTVTTIYQAGLYGANYANNVNKTNYCAAFDFLNDGQWAPITVSSANGDYNLFIDWTMSFTNN